MAYKKFQSDQLFTGHELLHNNHVLIADTDGRIKDIVLEQDAGDDIRKLKGILSPGFVNCHCHLELSHLKNAIPPGTGLIEFLCQVVTKRETAPSQLSFQAKTQAIINGEKEMYDKLAQTQPIGRMGEPDEIAFLALYLCSDAAAFITGTNYPIDGGFLNLHG